MPSASRARSSGGSGAVTLEPGETAKTVIHWTDPGPVPADDCQEAAATLVTLRVPSLKHTWRLPLKAQVCTTFEFRPDSTPLAARRLKRVAPRPPQPPGQTFVVGDDPRHLAPARGQCRLDQLPAEPA